MPGDMSGDIFFNPAEICYFFEIAVHFLIAGNWETISFLIQTGLFSYFFVWQAEREVEVCYRLKMLYADASV